MSRSASTLEKDWCWHKKCVKNIFHIKEMPILDITEEQIEKLANEAVNEGLTIPGVQKKLSLHLSSDTDARLTIDWEITEKEVRMYAMEDFCQLSNRLTQDKYRGSYENCGKIIKKYSDTPGLDLVEMYLRVLGSFVMGNSDMHLKNFSDRLIWLICQRNRKNR